MWDGSTYQAFIIPSVPSQLASEPQLLRDHVSLRARSPLHSLAQIVAAALLVLPVGAQVRADTCVEPPVARLTSTGQRNGQPFWAPNGEQVAFVSNRSGSWQVWIMSATGANARQITQVPGPVGWPSWAPDGSAILFYGSTPAGYRMFKVLVASRRREPLYHESHQDFRPLLSPDGMQLLFDRSGHDRPADHDLFVRNIRDGSLRQITQDAGYDSDARWSPDGRRIVWHSDRNSSTSNQTQIYSSSADGSDVRQLTRGPGTAGYPSWSPDGKRIAYTVEFEGNRDVWLMDADGTNRHRLTTHAGFDGDPAWSPAGDRLVISTGRFGGQELALVELARCRK